MANDDQVDELQVEDPQQYNEKLRAGLILAQAIINDLAEKIKSLSEGNQDKTLRIEDLKQQIDDITRLMTKNEDELKSSLVTIGSLTNEKINLRNRMSRLERENETYLTDISTLRQEVDGNKQLIQSANSNLVMLRKDNAELNLVIDNLLIQKQSDAEQINSIQYNLKKAKELNHNLQEDQDSLLTINAQLEADKLRSFDENEGIKHQLNQLQNKISLLQDDLNDAKQQSEVVNEPESEDDGDSLYDQILNEETIKNKELADEISGLKQRIESIQHQSREKIDLLEKKNTELQDSIESANQSLENRQNENQAINEQLTTRQDEVVQLKIELEQKNTHLGELEPQLANNQIKILELMQELAKQKAAHQEALAQVQANLEKRNEQIDLNQKDFTRLQEEHNQVILKKSTELDDLQRQNRQLNSEIEQVKQEKRILDDNQQVNNELEGRLERLSSQLQLEQIKNTTQQENIDQLGQKLDDELAAQQVQALELAALKQEQVLRQQKISNLEIQIARHDEEIKGKNRDIDNLEKQIRDSERLEAQNIEHQHILQARHAQEISDLQVKLENLSVQNSQNQQHFQALRYELSALQALRQELNHHDSQEVQEPFHQDETPKFEGAASSSESTSEQLKSESTHGDSPLVPPAYEVDDSQEHQPYENSYQPVPESQYLPEEPSRVEPPSYDDMADIPKSLRADYEPNDSPIKPDSQSFESFDSFSSSSSDPILEFQEPLDESSDKSQYNKALAALKREISRSKDYELLDMIRAAKTKQDLQKRTEFNGLNRKHLALLPNDNDIAFGLAKLAEVRIAELENRRSEMRDKGLTPLSGWEDIQQHQNDILKERYNNDIRPLQYLRPELRYLSSKPYLWLNPAFQGSAKRYSSQLAKPMQELSNATEIIVPYLNRQRCELVEALAALPVGSEMDGLPIARRKQINHQRQLFDRYLRNVKMELKRYLPLQTLFNGDDSKHNLVLKQGLIKTIEQAQENKKDIKLIKQFETTSEDYPISKREERLTDKDTTIKARHQRAMVSNPTHFNYQMIDRIEPDTFREYTITEQNKLVGRFIEERTSFPDKHDDEIKLTANLFPDASNSVGRVQYAMTMAAQLLAGLSKAPTKDNPIVLRGSDRETTKFLWTAFMVLGESTPGMTFDKNAIKVMSTAFQPENETGLLTRFSFSSCYNSFFKGNNVVKKMKNAYKDVISDKMGHAKEHAAVVDKAATLSQHFKGNLKNIEASHREEENDSPRPFSDPF